MDAHIARAVERRLTIEDVGGGDVGAFCDAFACRVVERYLAGDLPWPDGDMAMNNIFSLITRDAVSHPDYAWQVYLAFDAGEYVAPGGDAVTRPMILALARPSVAS